MSKWIRAVRCHGYAGLDASGKPLPAPRPLREVLSLDQIPSPECEPGQVLIATNYAGVQYPDALQAQGLYQERPPLPYVPGMDVSGKVLQTGTGVDQFAVGDRVIGQMSVGGLAEVVKVDATSLWPAPAGVPLSKCANLGRNYCAAYHALKVVGQISPGDLVLVDGASGGVGMAAIQLAKAMGAQVIAAVSVAEKQPLPQAAGADCVLCYGKHQDSYRAFKNAVRQAASELGHPQGVDVVVDLVQGELFEAALVSCIRPLGKLCLVGFTAGQKPIRPGILLIKQAAAIGSLWGPWAKAHPAAHQRHVGQILHFLATGAVQPRVERVYPLSDFIDAFELFEKNQARANTVVCVREEREEERETG